MIILDTDAVMTAVWSDVLLGKRLPELSGGKAADFYLLTDIDVPFVQDAIRYFPNQAGRQRIGLWPAASGQAALFWRSGIRTSRCISATTAPAQAREE